MDAGHAIRLTLIPLAETDEVPALVAVAADPSFAEKINPVAAESHFLEPLAMGLTTPSRACIQSSLPSTQKLKGPEVSECSNMRVLGFTCACLFYCEAACIDACGACAQLPWLPPPSLYFFTTFACCTLLGAGAIPIKPGFTVPPVVRPTLPDIWCKLQ